MDWISTLNQDELDKHLCEFINYDVPNVEHLARLIKAGANVNKGALFCAIQQENVDYVKMLIAAGADVNTLDPDAGTALGFATRFPEIAVVKLLVESGADVNKPDLEGKTPLACVAANRIKIREHYRR